MERLKSEMKRFRLSYSKKGLIRFTSNLDIQRIWERSFRRTGIPIAYSQGFHPQAKIQQASPLPLGFTGEYEIIDFWVENTTENCSILKDRLNSYLPDGILVNSLKEIDIAEKTLMQYVDSSAYELLFAAFIKSEVIENLYDGFISANEIIVIKHNGKKYDAKPRIIDASISQNRRTIRLTLSNRPNFSTRPDHILDAFGFNPAHTIINRKEIFLNNE